MGGHTVAAQVVPALLTLPATAVAEAACFRAFGAPGATQGVWRLTGQILGTELLASLQVLAWTAAGAVPAALLWSASESLGAALLGAACVAVPALWRWMHLCLAAPVVAYRGVAYSQALLLAESAPVGGRARFAIVLAGAAAAAYGAKAILEAVEFTPRESAAWQGTDVAAALAGHAADLSGVLVSIWLLTGLFLAVARTRGELAEGRA